MLQWLLAVDVAGIVSSHGLLGDEEQIISCMLPLLHLLGVFDIDLRLLHGCVAFASRASAALVALVCGGGFGHLRVLLWVISL